MRLWSLHPSLLDTAGLTACWREGLLARSVLAGKTIGYCRHPQLERFRACADPLVAVDTYLHGILAEAQRRGYRFDGTKIGPADESLRIGVTEGQLVYELAHLKRKLIGRAPQSAAALETITALQPHPLFRVVAGGVEKWEVIK